MKRSTSIGVTIVITGVTITTLALIFKIANARAGETAAPLMSHLIHVAFISIGGLTVARRPENRMSWLFAWIGISMAVVELSNEYATFGYVTRGGGVPLKEVAAWLSSWTWPLAFGPVLVLLPLWFPSGRVPGPRWKIVERTMFGILIILPVLLSVTNDPESTAPYDNPLALPALADVAQVVFTVLTPVFPFLVLAAAAALIVRFRRSRGIERQQMKWLVAGVVLMFVYIVIDSAVTLVAGPKAERTIAMRALEMVAYTALPMSSGIAILRYRLYNIDVIVKRALVYGAVTGLLITVYLSVVVTLGFVLEPVTAESDLAVAASTLAVAALFRPLRARVQRFIDRRFYRNRYDALQTLRAFGVRLRNEVDTDVVRSDMLAVVGETLHPVRASLWLRSERQA